MLQTLGLIMQLIDWIIEHTKQERLDQPVMPNNFKGTLSAMFR